MPQNVASGQVLSNCFHTECAIKVKIPQSDFKILNVH